MRAEEAGWRMLLARRESPHHIQVRVSRVRDSRSETCPYRWTVDAEVRRVFRSTSGGADNESRLNSGDAISFEVEFCVRRDTPLLEVIAGEGDAPGTLVAHGPIGPITVCLEDLEFARFLEVFLDRDLTVPAGQVEPIGGPTKAPRMSLDDPDLVQLAAKEEQRRSDVRELISKVNHVDEVISQLIEERASDAFKASDVKVFLCGDTHVVRIMLPNEHPGDLGSLRKLVKNELSAGHVSKADARIACTRSGVFREVTHKGGTSVFLA